MKSQTTVRALDVGYGNTKFSVTPRDGAVEFQSFLSLAPTAVTTDVSAGAMLARDTVVVAVNGNHYEVGPDSELATDVRHAHVTDDAYVTRPEYQALSLGANLHGGAKN